MDATTINQIKADLIALAGAMNRTDTRQMLDAMERLDRVVTECGAGLDPRLAHFLERRSYVKALEFLGGNPAVPAGTCAPKAGK